MKLPLKGLTFGSQEFKFHLDGAFFNEIGESEVRDASVEACVTVTRKHDGFFLLSARCNGTLVIPCDRCLDDMTHTVDTTYDVTVRYGEAYDDSADDVIEVPESWHELDIAPMLRDTVLLTIPVMHCHDNADDCDQQVASRIAGMDNDGEGTPDGEGSNDPRWDALKALKQ